MEEALDSYIEIEHLYDVICRKCSLHKTLSHLIESLKKTSNLQKTDNKEIFLKNQFNIQLNNISKAKILKLRKYFLSNQISDNTYTSSSETNIEEEEEEEDNTINFDNTLSINNKDTTIKNIPKSSNMNNIDDVLTKISKDIRHKADKVTKALCNNIQSEIVSLILLFLLYI